MYGSGRSGVKARFPRLRHVDLEVGGFVAGELVVNGGEGAIVGKIAQETLAELVGATRSRVNVFMNKSGSLVRMPHI